MSILSDLQTRKLGLFELIAMGFDLYLKHFLRFFSFFCITLLPFLILIQIFALNPTQNSFFLVFIWIFYIFYFFVALPVYSLALSILTERYTLGENPHLNIVIRQALLRLLPLIGLSIRFFINFYLRLLLFIIPGIIYAVNNGYYALALILRDQRGKAAFQYSRSLVKGNWWKVFFFNILTLIIAFGLQILMTRVLNNVIANSPVLVAVLSGILAILLTLGVPIGGVLLFLNLEFQKR
jgi:hypothetical protein